MACIDGLTQEQCDKLVNVKVGDLVYLDDPSDHYPDEIQGGEDEEYDHDDGSSNGSDEHEGVGAADPQGEDSNIDGDDPDDNASHHCSQCSDADVFPHVGGMYVVTCVTRENEIIDNVELTRLHYSDKVDRANGSHDFHIYGQQVIHYHPETCPQCYCLSITEFVKGHNLKLTVEPNGDYIRTREHLVEENLRRSSRFSDCITGCKRGFLQSADMLRDMIKDYDPPTLNWAAATGQGVPRLLQRPVCPVCIGQDYLKEQQMLQVKLLEAGFVDIGEIVEFHGRLNRRRQELPDLGYGFCQFNERHWGWFFNDMVQGEEEVEGDIESDDDDLDDWEALPEGFDPSDDIPPSPASVGSIGGVRR